MFRRAGGIALRYFAIAVVLLAIAYRRSIWTWLSSLHLGSDWQWGAFLADQAGSLFAAVVAFGFAYLVLRIQFHHERRQGQRQQVAIEAERLFDLAGDLRLRAARLNTVETVETGQPKRVVHPQYFNDLSHFYTKFLFLANTTTSDQLRGRASDLAGKVIHFQEVIETMPDLEIDEFSVKNEILKSGARDLAEFATDQQDGIVKDLKRLNALD